MAIFITGGYGHIGSWTALLLARQGQDIIVYDTNDDTPDCLIEIANRITFIKGDVLNFAALREAFEHQKLDFTYVEDAARGIALLFNAENLRHKVFNIATGQAHSVGEVVELAKKYTHSSVPVHVGPGELMRRSEALDIGRAAAELDYEPKVGLEEGIKRYADWLKTTLPLSLRTSD